MSTRARGPSASTSREQVVAVQATLEGAGIEFLNGDAPGVRFRPKKRN
jgi:hypothetical protein